MHDASPPPTGYATGPFTKPPNWHGLVAWDVWLNNLSTGLFLVAAVSELAAPAVFTPVTRLAYPVALVLLLADLLLLVLDLGDPRRFHHMLRVFKPSSPMSLGVWCLSAYAFALTAAVLLALAGGEGPILAWTRRAVLACALTPALGSLVYKGVLFSTSSQPVWKDARWLGAYLASAAVVLGGATLLALAVLTGREQAVTMLRPALGLLIVLNLAPLALLASNVRAALLGRCRNRRLARVAALALAGGTLLPLGLLPVAAGTPALLGVVLSILLGNLLSRFVIVQLPQR